MTEVVIHYNEGSLVMRKLKIFELKSFQHTF